MFLSLATGFSRLLGFLLKDCRLCVQLQSTEASPHIHSELDGKHGWFDGTSASFGNQHPRCCSSRALGESAPARTRACSTRPTPRTVSVCSVLPKRSAWDTWRLGGRALPHTPQPV